MVGRRRTNEYRGGGETKKFLLLGSRSESSTVSVHVRVSCDEVLLLKQSGQPYSSLGERFVSV